MKSCHYYVQGTGVKRECGSSGESVPRWVNDGFRLQTICLEHDCTKRIGWIGVHVKKVTGDQRRQTAV
jgi:hypothetical protein